MADEFIPTHTFADADELGFPFRMVELTYPTEYATNTAHRHNYYEIFYFSQGSGDHLVDFAEYPIHAPSLHFVAPGQVHRVNRSADSLGKVILFTHDLISFHPEINDILYRLPFLKGNQPRPAFPLEGEIMPQVLEAIQNIEKEYAKKESASLEIIRSYIYIMLLRCRDFYEEKNREESAAPDSLLARFRQLVEQRYKEWHLPNQYADELKVTPKYLNEIVKKSLGMPPGELIRERIMLEAKRMLYNTDLSAKEIAYHLNFEDPAYFSRFFRQNAGLSVKEYRDSSRKKYK
jgi:AraC-like DNA-binding protein